LISADYRWINPDSSEGKQNHFEAAFPLATREGYYLNWLYRICDGKNWPGYKPFV
jgi:hypothetical protein